jgi:hypothetical protein
LVKRNEYVSYKAKENSEEIFGPMKENAEWRSRINSELMIPT